MHTTPTPPNAPSLAQAREYVTEPDDRGDGARAQQPARPAANEGRHTHINAGEWESGSIRESSSELTSPPFLPAAEMFADARESWHSAVLWLRSTLRVGSAGDAKCHARQALPRKAQHLPLRPLPKHGFRNTAPPKTTAGASESRRDGPIRCSGFHALLFLGLLFLGLLVRGCGLLDVHRLTLHACAARAAGGGVAQHSKCTECKLEVKL